MFASWAGAGGGGVIAGLGVCGVIFSTVSSAATLMQDFRTGEGGEGSFFFGGGGAPRCGVPPRVHAPIPNTPTHTHASPIIITTHPHQAT